MRSSEDFLTHEVLSTLKWNISITSNTEQISEIFLFTNVDVLKLDFPNHLTSLQFVAHKKVVPPFKRMEHRQP